MSTNKIPADLPIKELHEKLCESYDDVKLIGNETIELKYSGTKLHITKDSGGYIVKAAFPKWLGVLGGVIAGITVVVLGALEIGIVLRFLLGVGVTAIFLMIVGAIYNASKKEKVQEFCDHYSNNM